MNSLTRIPFRDKPDRLSCQARLCELVELKDFPHHAIAALRELISVDLGCHAELDLRALHVITVFDRDQPATQALRDSWRGHLLAPEFRQRWAAQPELVPLRLHELDRHHLVVGCPIAPDLGVFLSLHRERDEFTNHEFELLASVAPFVALGRRNAQRHTAALRERRIADLRLNWVSTARVPITPSGDVGVLSTSARAWLVDFFGPLPADSGRLPRPMLSWLSRHVAGPLERVSGDAKLIVRLAGTPQSGLVLTLQHEQPIPSSTIAELLTLCLREVDVLRWRLANKNRNEIAAILGIKPGTVKTHIQSLYAKLGLEPEDGSSVAAATIVLDRLARRTGESVDGSGA